MELLMIHAIDEDDVEALEPLINNDSLNDIPYHHEVWWTSRPNHIAPIAYAASKNSLKCVKFLLSKGAYPDGWDSFSDLTALGIAVHNRYTDVAKCLINNGAKITEFDMWDGETLVCILTQDLQVIRDEYIEWKKRNYKATLLLLCARKYHKSGTLEIVDNNVVSKISRYVYFAVHKTN